MRLLVILALLCLAFSAYAEDGVLFSRNVSKTPDWETDHATLRVLYTNAPVHPAADPYNLDGILENDYVSYPIPEDSELTQIEDRYFVQPLIAFYHDGPVVHPEDSAAFPGHGNRDVFGAVSFDDGNTWKKTNLSDSGFRSSFRLKDGTDYPGDTFRLFANSAGNQVMVAWASRYARGGNPNYAIVRDEADANYGYIEDLAAHLGTTVDGLYLYDMWGVAGSQRSSDFADEDYPTVGEVPYAALWCCRGTLEDCDVDGEYDTVVWRQPERLTSARRDVHRIEVGVAGGAGWVITWQEDPDGLRPGHGEGPGEGWSGAVAHHETDIWYSFISWADFGLVNDPLEDETVFDPLTPVEYIDTYYTDGVLQADLGVPMAAVPMSMPVRLTDNAMGGAMPEDYDPAVAPSYLYELDEDGDGTADLCEYTVTVEVIKPNSDGIPETIEMCVAQDGRLMRGNTASTRCRVNLRGYDSDGDGANDNAWVVLAYEESKGLGEEEDYDELGLIEKTDMGKNIWYHTFNMFEPELVSQGLMLNQPAVYPGGTPFDYTSPSTSRLVEYPITALGSAGNTYDYRFMRIDPDPIYEEQAGFEDPVLLQTEISRRFSLISQPASDAGPSGMVALAMWKQGIIRQGGPADVYARRFVLPEDFDAAVDNPFDYANMECGTWLFDDGSNPRYLKGICASPAMTMSGTSLIDEPWVVSGSTAANGSQPTNSVGMTVEELVAAFPFNDYFDDIDMSLLPDGVEQLPKIYEWSQSGPDYGHAPDVSSATYSATSYRTSGSFPMEWDVTEGTNFDDQSWENPYDVSKGHRGYMCGDYIMMLYCWSPNWLANTVGHDNYNLYVRRSFDGGQTWTTLPTGWEDWRGWFTDEPVNQTPEGITADGTLFYEWMGPAGGDSEYKVVFDLDPGVSEPIRNMSLLTGTKLTVLDPRYAPTGGATHTSIEDENGDFVNVDDEYNPSTWFITFEEGDNTTVALGEATPMDMYYSRATNYGDDFEYVWDLDLVTDPDNPTFDVTTTENEGYFDWLEGKKDVHAAEAAMSGSPGGMFFWTIWNEWKEDAHENAFDSDATVRRLMFLDDEGGDGSGGDGNGGANKPDGSGKNKTTPLIDLGLDDGLIR